MHLSPYTTPPTTFRSSTVAYQLQACPRHSFTRLSSHCPSSLITAMKLNLVRSWRNWRSLHVTMMLLWTQTAFETLAMMAFIKIRRHVSHAVSFVQHVIRATRRLQGPIQRTVAPLFRWQGHHGCCRTRCVLSSQTSLSSAYVSSHCFLFFFNWSGLGHYDSLKHCVFMCVFKSIFLTVLSTT